MKNVTAERGKLVRKIRSLVGEKWGEEYDRRCRREGGVVVRKEGERGGQESDGCSRRVVVERVAGVVKEEERFVGMDLGS